MVPPATLRWLATLPLACIAALPCTQVRGWATDINDPRLADARRSVEREMVSEGAGYSVGMLSGVPSTLLALDTEAQRSTVWQVRQGMRNAGSRAARV